MKHSKNCVGDIGVYLTTGTHKKCGTIIKIPIVGCCDAVVNEVMDSDEYLKQKRMLQETHYRFCPQMQDTPQKPIPNEK